MRFILLIILVTFFPSLRSQRLRADNKLHLFFVARRDTKEAICIAPYSFDPFPTFDLDKLQFPPDVGFMHWDWLSDWQFQNDTDVPRGGDAKISIAADQPFHFVAREYIKVHGLEINILATNITLWVVNEKRPHHEGLLLELDHFNETTKLKDTTMKHCHQNPERKKANCTIVDYKNGTNFLSDGKHWTEFRIRLKKKHTGVEMFEKSNRKNKPVVVQWTWNNISNPFPSGEIDLFAKSYQRNSALITRGYYNGPDLANNNKIKRKYTKKSSGKLCVDVRWNKNFLNDSIELMEVKNLASGRVQPPTNTTHDKWQNSYFQWNQLDAGQYEFILSFDERKPTLIDLCYDFNSNITRTWTITITPKAIAKCQFKMGSSKEFSVWPSSTPHPTLKPNWTLEKWEHVCNRLGIFSNDTEVPIKFCNWKGCNFSKCPHLQDDTPFNC